MKKTCGVLVLVLLAVIAAMVWAFVIRGSASKAEDGRTLVRVSASDRAFFLAEMRGWLEHVQGIVEALAEGDMKQAAQEARAAGKVDMSQIPGSLLRSLPLEMKRLGFGTHAAFRDMAANIEKGANAKQALSMLSSIMLNCTGCHAGYRLGERK